MRNIIISMITALAAYGASSAHASDVSVGVSIAGEVTPGVYGRVDIGNHPPPVLYSQPVIITKSARPIASRPLYMHVPPGHAKNWGKHCHKYNACGQPVYFVKSAEYEPSRKGDRGHKDDGARKDRKGPKEHKAKRHPHSHD
ncbi:MAG TPA: hypothetical protein VM571_08135 [Noviherbaspirillum sp.]|nr:hypothetical protein [Noviherbaspirillum sp.]